MVGGSRGFTLFPYTMLFRSIASWRTCTSKSARSTTSPNTPSARLLSPCSPTKVRRCIFPTSGIWSTRCARSSASSGRQSCCRPSPRTGRSSSPSRNGGADPQVRADPPGPARFLVSPPGIEPRGSLVGPEPEQPGTRVVMRFQSPSYGSGSAPITRPAGALPATTFQSPSYRGGSAPGSLHGGESGRKWCFNPLLIGAGALPKFLPSPNRRALRFQSPSYRGGSAPSDSFVVSPTLGAVSIPFFSGGGGSPRKLRGGVAGA